MIAVEIARKEWKPSRWLPCTVWQLTLLIGLSERGKKEDTWDGAVSRDRPMAEKTGNQVMQRSASEKLLLFTDPGDFLHQLVRRNELTDFLSENWENGSMALSQI